MGGARSTSSSASMPGAHSPLHLCSLMLTERLSSGHFCGVAEMLTPVDYTRSSTVWAQDKWKGVIKVKWIFVRDIPNAALRHIRLT